MVGTLDYTDMITVIYWLKRIMIVLELTSVVKFISGFVFLSRRPLLALIVIGSMWHHEVCINWDKVSPPQAACKRG